jgi:uncharacterized membrane protein
MNPKVERLAGLGAFGVSLGVVLVYALLVAIMWPNRSGGSNIRTFAVLAFSAAVPTLLLIGAHVALGRQLLADAAARK